MTRAWPIALVAAAACAESSLTETGRLELTGVDPPTASARGGQRIVIAGVGFGSAPEVWVREQPVTVAEVGEEAITVVLPPLQAGPAPIRVVAGATEGTLEDALEIEPLALRFVRAPSWSTPQLTPPVVGLAALDVDRDGRMEVLAATGAGLKVLRPSATQALAATDVVAPEDEEPVAVQAVAVDEEAGLVATCAAAETAPVRIHAVAAAGLVERAEAIVDGAACRRIAFVRVTAHEPKWLLADTGAGLAAWKPGSAGWARVEVEATGLPADLRAFVPAELDGDGDEALVVSGTAGGAATLALAELVELEGKLSVRIVAPFPPAASVAASVLPFDADGDGDTDLLSCGDGQDALFVNDGHARFFDDAWRALPFERSAGRVAARADLDFDGRGDLVIATADGPDRLYVATDGGFADRTPALGLEGPHGSTALALADVDGDGDVDVVTADAAGAIRLRVLAEGVP